MIVYDNGLLIYKIPDDNINKVAEDLVKEEYFKDMYYNKQKAIDNNFGTVPSLIINVKESPWYTLYHYEKILNYAVILDKVHKNYVNVLVDMSLEELFAEIVPKIYEAFLVLKEKKDIRKPRKINVLMWCISFDIFGDGEKYKEYLPEISRSDTKCDLTGGYNASKFMADSSKVDFIEEAREEYSKYQERYKKRKRKVLAGSTPPFPKVNEVEISD